MFSKKDKNFLKGMAQSFHKHFLDRVSEDLGRTLTQQEIAVYENLVRETVDSIKVVVIP